MNRTTWTSKLISPCPRCGASFLSYHFEGRYKRCSSCGRNNQLEDQAETLVSAYRLSLRYGSNHAWETLKYSETMKRVITYLKMLQETKPEIPLKPKFRKFLEVFDYHKVG